MSTTSALRQRWFAWVYPRIDQRQRAATAGIRADLVGDLEGEVLEVGCGPGTNFEHYGLGARVTAVDYNPHMLRHARASLPAPRAEVGLLLADATALPFESASFDAYATTLVLCSVPDLPAAVDEAWRVLRPGGQLRIFEHVRSGSGWKAAAQALVNPLWGYVADGCHLDRDTHRAFIRRGFEVVEERHPTISAEPLPLVVLKARKPS